MYFITLTAYLYHYIYHNELWLHFAISLPDGNSMRTMATSVHYAIVPCRAHIKKSNTKTQAKRMEEGKVRRRD